MSQLYRLPSGGRIARSNVLSVTFNGQSYQGFEGDTLAAALLAAGVGVLGGVGRRLRKRARHAPA